MFFTETPQAVHSNCDYQSWTILRFGTSIFKGQVRTIFTPFPSFSSFTLRRYKPFILILPKLDYFGSFETSNFQGASSNHTFFLFFFFFLLYVILHWSYNYHANNMYQQVAPIESYVEKVRTIFTSFPSLSSFKLRRYKPFILTETVKAGDHSAIRNAPILKGSFEPSALLPSLSSQRRYKLFILIETV